MRAKWDMQPRTTQPMPASYSGFILGGACQMVTLWYSVYFLLLFCISKQLWFIIANQKLFVFITTGQKNTKGESVKAGHLEGNGPWIRAESTGPVAAGWALALELQNRLLDTTTGLGSRVQNCKRANTVSWKREPGWRHDCGRLGEKKWGDNCQSKWGNWFSPSASWAPEIKFRLSGMVTSLLSNNFKFLKRK